jgi:hypothetical protein
VQCLAKWFPRRFDFIVDSGEIELHDFGGFKLVRNRPPIGPGREAYF